MSPIFDIIVAETSTDFKILLMRSAMITEFLTAADSERFSGKNGRLRERMEKALAAHLGDELAESDSHLNHDWWPDHTRPVEISERAFTFATFEILRSLLTGEFDEWRIQAVVYTDIQQGTTFVGSALIWSDKIIVGRQLFDWMKSHHFEFLSAHIRSFSLANDDLESERHNLMNDPS